jgi:hypothetical protein
MLTTVYSLLIISRLTCKFLSGYVLVYVRMRHMAVGTSSYCAVRSYYQGV